MTTNNEAQRNNFLSQDSFFCTMTAMFFKMADPLSQYNLYHSVMSNLDNLYISLRHIVGLVLGLVLRLGQGIWVISHCDLSKSAISPSHYATHFLTLTSMTLTRYTSILTSKTLYYMAFHTQNSTGNPYYKRQLRQNHIRQKITPRQLRL